MIVKINQINYKALPKLVQELVDHYKISKSLLGFLMSLNRDELDRLAESLENPVDELATFPLIVFFKGIPEEGTKATKSELEEVAVRCMSDVALINLYKKGLISLKPSKDDDDDEWIINTTKEGDELAAKMFNKKEDKEE